MNQNQPNRPPIATHHRKPSRRLKRIHLKILNLNQPPSLDSNKPIGQKPSEQNPTANLLQANQEKTRNSQLKATTEVKMATNREGMLNNRRPRFETIDNGSTNNGSTSQVDRPGGGVPGGGMKMVDHTTKLFHRDYKRSNSNSIINSTTMTESLPSNEIHKEIKLVHLVLDRAAMEGPVSHLALIQAIRHTAKAAKIRNRDISRSSSSSHEDRREVKNNDRMRTTRQVQSRSRAQDPNRGSTKHK